MAQAGENNSVADLDLDALRWKKRVLVLFFPLRIRPFISIAKAGFGFQRTSGCSIVSS